MQIETLKKWLPLSLLLFLVVVAWASGLTEAINLETIKSHRDSLQDSVSSAPVASILLFISVYAASVALSLPIATFLTLLGGFLFGLWAGTAAIVIGATSGATVLFLVTRSSVGDTLRTKAGSLYNRISDNMERNAVGYMLFMRLVPLFPFFLVNIVPALFNVRLSAYILTTLVGIVPGTLVYANAGKQLGTIETLGDLASTQTLLAFTLLGVFALIPGIYKQLKNGKKALAVLVMGVALIVPSMRPAVAADTGYLQFLKLYDDLLQAYTEPLTRKGIDYIGVSYDKWGADARHKQALNILLDQAPASFVDNEEKKAFWINAYNFLTIELIVREGERETIKNLGGLFTSPWKRHSWFIAGHEYTLDHIEHDILRPMGDARIHFAINCASVSCPDLRDESYKSQKLNQQLDEQVRLTLGNQGKGLRIEGDKLYASKIFDWFKKDFNKGNVTGWISRYVDLHGKPDLKYLPYDWSLNKAQ